MSRTGAAKLKPRDTFCQMFVADVIQLSARSPFCTDTQPNPGSDDEGLAYSRKVPYSSDNYG